MLNPDVQKIIDNAISQKLPKLSLGGFALSPEDIKYLCKTLATNKTIYNLDISNCNIGAKGASRIAAVLKKNTPLQTLNLSGNNIGAAGAKHIGKGLKKNATLQVLNLSGNNIEDTGAKHIADALGGNITLRRADLSGNTIGAAGAKYIGKGLEKNTMLSLLNLSDNNIRAAGARDIAASLEKNITLYKLGLSNNNIGSLGIRWVADRLEKNIGLRLLNLYDRDIPHDGDRNIPHDGDTLIKLAKIHPNLRYIQAHDNDPKKKELKTILKEKKRAYSPDVVYNIYKTIGNISTDSMALIANYVLRETTTAAEVRKINRIGDNKTNKLRPKNKDSNGGETKNICDPHRQALMQKWAQDDESKIR